MNKLALASLLLLSTAAFAEKPKPNPADYTISVHVTESRLVFVPHSAFFPACPICSEIQLLNVIIGGKKYELEGPGGGYGYWLLRTGNYKARLIEDSRPKTGRGTSSEYLREYEFLFPDGVTRSYDVSGEEE